MIRDLSVRWRLVCQLSDDYVNLSLSEYLHAALLPTSLSNPSAEQQLTFLTNQMIKDLQLIDKTDRTMSNINFLPCTEGANSLRAEP